MITRLYVNNFRCLVAFKAEFDSFAVLCGPNGAGKSSVFDALRLLRNLGTGEAVLGGTGEQEGNNAIRLVPCGGRREVVENLPAELERCLGAGGHTTLMVWPTATTTALIRRL